LVVDAGGFRFETEYSIFGHPNERTGNCMDFERYGELADHDSADGMHRYELQDRYLELTRHVLPSVARLKGWALKEDHCFMRVILDQLFQDCWYNHLDRRLTAYKQLNDQQLRHAISLATAIENGDVVMLEKWNRESLRWRQKTAARPADS